MIRRKPLECRRVRILLLAAAALVIKGALAAPFAVQLGDTRLALDAPPGFSDVQATGSPRLLDLAEALTSASNRILLFALEDGDVRRFTVGDSLELRRYVEEEFSPEHMVRDYVAAYEAGIEQAKR